MRFPVKTKAELVRNFVHIMYLEFEEEQEGKFSRCPAAFSNFGLSAKLITEIS